MIQLKFKLLYTYDNAYGTYEFTLENNFQYKTSAGSSALGNITRIENLLEGIPKKLVEIETEITTTNEKIVSLESILMQKDFKDEGRLKELNGRLSSIVSALDMENKQPVSDNLSHANSM